MNSKFDFLKIFHNSIFVGRLALNKNNLAVFEYDDEWLEDGFSISPLFLPLKKETFVARRDPFNGLFGVFNDSLPDGWGNLLLDRVLKQKGINPFSISVLERLSIVGKSGLGALSYQPEFVLSDSLKTPDLDYFAKEAKLILNAQSSEALDDLYRFNASSGGARPKVIIEFDNEYWMVKFGALYDPDNIGEIEYNASLAAINAGIEMPETRLFKNRYFGVKLFDRDMNQRFHVHSASGLLYADHRIPALDYDDLLKLTMYLTKNVEELEKMFRLMIFNLLLENKDDHAKNFSFIFKNNKWVLAPAYDLTPNSGFNGNHSTTVLGNGNPDISDVIQLGKLHSIKQKSINLMIEEVRSALDSYDFIS